MVSRFLTKNDDYSVPTTIRYPKIPVQEFVNLAAAFHHQKAATDFYGTLITFQEIRTKILRMTNALVAHDVRYATGSEYEGFTAFLQKREPDFKGL